MPQLHWTPTVSLRRRSVRRLAAACACALLVAAPAGAQKAASVGSGNTRGWLGFGIACGPCSLRYTSADRTTGVWEFSSPPVVHDVTPNGPAAQAGLAAGDTLVAIDGLGITTPEGGRRFGRIRVGEPVRLTWKRAGRTGTATITPVAPAAAVAAAGTVDMQAVERALAVRDSAQAAARMRLDSSEYMAARYRMLQAAKEMRAQAARLRLQQAEAARVQAAADSETKRSALESRLEAARVASAYDRAESEYAAAYTEMNRVIAARANAVGASQFTGSVAGADIEVRGLNVRVTSDRSTGALVIRGDSVTVTVRPGGGSR